MIDENVLVEEALRWDVRQRGRSEEKQGVHQLHLCQNHARARKN